MQDGGTLSLHFVIYSYSLAASFCVVITIILITANEKKKKRIYEQQLEARVQLSDFDNEIK